MNRPWSLQVTLVEGCSRLCPFCGLNGIRNSTGNYVFADQHTLENIARGWADLNPEGRVEFAMHGEPLMHPRYLDAFKLFRTTLPKANLQVTTNGVRFRGKRDMAVELGLIYNAGVDYVILDTYYPERDELRDKAFAMGSGITVRDFYDDCVPSGWSPWHNHRRKHRRLLVLMDDLLARNGEVKSRVIMNHAGNAPNEPVPPEPLRKTCTLPFREITVGVEGNVHICCMDWGGELVMGNVNRTPMPDIWYGERFTAVRKVLGQKLREFTPCSRCNAGSGSRSGLLPKLGAPTERDLGVLTQAVYENTAKNRRSPWISGRLERNGDLIALPVL